MSVTSEESEQGIYAFEASEEFRGKILGHPKEEEDLRFLAAKEEEEEEVMDANDKIEVPESVRRVWYLTEGRRKVLPEVHMPFGSGVDKKLIEGRCEEEGEAGHSAEPDHYGKQQRKWVTQNGVEH
eukprot:TRINITY_DN2595_c0_g1_i1.p1 TRINITY_DN2595_c0_g1~~TRINITY_DN2595_c0_g1_i1.p1  ORF type:complete len:140 (+),score=36.55 TRINITY_DN2595_c0_g1_i1:44-421(+)